MKARVIFCSTFLVFLIQESQGKDGDPKKCFPSCPNGWEVKEDSCYLWTDTKKTWVEAERHCNNKDGHLASVTNLNIHNYISTKARKSKDTEYGYWIGGTYLEKENRWQWSDGSKWEFKWGTGQPNNADGGDQHCLTVYNEYALDGWNDVKCEDSRGFVCICPICKIHNPNDTTDSSNTNVGSNEENEFPIWAVALPIGIILFVIAIIITVCALRKHSKRRQEDKTSAELNPVYGIYQLEEGSYERQYSTHEIVDDNHYYEQ